MIAVTALSWINASKRMKSPTICSPCLYFITRHERRLSGQWQPNFTLRFHRTISSFFKEDLGRCSPKCPSQYCSYVARIHESVAAEQPLLSAGLTSNSLYRIKDVGRRNREENAVLPERCGVRLNKLAAIHRLVANALTLFRDLKSAESSPWQSLVPRELFLPVTRSLSRYCLDSDT